MGADALSEVFRAVRLTGAVFFNIDVRDPWQTYSAGQFCVDALEVIRQIHARGHLPLLAGGTMLYFRALFAGLAPLPPADRRLRAEIDAEAAARG